MVYVNVADNHGYIVHHKHYIDMSNIYNTDITLDFNNLELLCIACHNKEHFDYGSFTDDGQLKADNKTALELLKIK